MLWIQKIETFLLKIEQFFLVLLLTLMMFFAFTQVILRQFFSTGILWADLFVRHLVLWTGFIGAACAMVRKRHFIIDLLKKNLSPGVKVCADLLTDVFEILVLALLLKGAFVFFMDDYQYGSELFSFYSLHVKSWSMTLIFPAGFILLLIHALLSAIKNACLLFRGKGIRE